MFSKFPLSEALLSDCMKECCDGSSSVVSLTRLCTESVVRPAVLFETAAEHGHIHVCEFLLNNGFSINGDECPFYDCLCSNYQLSPPDYIYYRQPPLKSAIEAEQTVTVRWLLEHGADPSLELDSDWHSFMGNNIDVAMCRLCYVNGFNNAEIFRLVVEYCIEHGMDKYDWEEMFDTFCRICDKRDIIDCCSPVETVRWLVEQNPTVAHKVYKEKGYDILKKAFCPLPMCKTLAGIIIVPSTSLACPICLETNHEVFAKTKCCKNNFHENCLDAWLRKSVTCPICRHVFKFCSKKSISLEKTSCDLKK